MKKKKKTKRKKKKITYQTKLNHTTTQLPMFGLEKGDETLGGTRKVIEMAYSTLVSICCVILGFLTLYKYYVILSPDSTTRLTSMMFNQGDFSDENISTKSNYTYVCPKPSPKVVLMAEREQECACSCAARRFRESNINVTEEMIVRKLTHEYLEELSMDWKGKEIQINNIYVMSSPLEGPFQSSPISLKEKVRGQWTGVDFHAFIVLTAMDKRWINQKNDIAFELMNESHWALDKNASGLYVSWINGKNVGALYTVMPYFGRVLRAEPLTYLCIGWIANCNQATSLAGYPMENLTMFLKNELDRPYSLLYDNCQSFSKRLFVEVIKENIWDPLPPSYFILDGSIEYYITFAVELSILINKIAVSTCCMNSKRLVTYVFLGYAFWLTSLGLTKIFMAPIGLIPNYFGWIFIRAIFLLKVYHCFRLFLRLKFKEKPALFLMMMVFVALS